MLDGGRGGLDAATVETVGLRGEDFGGGAGGGLWCVDVVDDGGVGRVGNLTKVICDGV